MVIIGSFLLNQVVFFGTNAMMWFIYHMDMPFFEQYKVEERPWPWKRSKKEAKEFRELVIGAIKVVLFNQVSIGDQYNLKLKYISDKYYSLFTN